MAEMRDIRVSAEAYEQLKQQADLYGLSVSEYVELMVNDPKTRIEKLKAAGIAVIGLGDTLADPNLSTQVREVMEEIYAEPEQSPKYSLLDLAGLIQLDEETDASERISEIMHEVFKDKLEQKQDGDSG